ncbi:MAG: hypothetical protein CLLPBCKN_000224 [Chroococcidiopsis cubana SAG 39.79]|uniref:hypothetical protein n=1 Tax=Chroococcidiopsis cubana TaxID=171392 RepID=UPI000D07D9C6|nr:hypothetical protein [Chroococcidiopsis cubana]MDZ4870836.1 hypothetical protein [Chroococcidiopsis cubana SAG 39.79]
MSAAPQKKVELDFDTVIFGSCLYGQNWIVAWNECQAWVEELISSIRNKQSFYQRGLRAMTLIQQAL